MMSHVMLLGCMWQIPRSWEDHVEGLNKRRETGHSLSITPIIPHHSSWRPQTSLSSSAFSPR